MGDDSRPTYSWRDLLSAEGEEVERAADALHASGKAAVAFAARDAAEALESAVGAGHRTAATVLLLGYSPTAAPLLARLQAGYSEEIVKLKPWSRPVPLRVAADVALSRLGDPGARRRLLEGIPDPDDAVDVFLLDVLPDIDAPEIWQALSALLEDVTVIPEGVPSGASRRRLCDHAVDAFQTFFALSLSFPANPGGRYAGAEREEVRRLFIESVPR